jgi:hypothetical protein
MRIVFATDSHLNKHYARMHPEQLAERRSRMRAAWVASVDHAVDTRADVYVHGGDLFDSPNPRASEIALAAEQFQRLRDAEVATVLIGGNHDIPRTRIAGSGPQAVMEVVRLAHLFSDPRSVGWWVGAGREGEPTVAIGGLPPDHGLPAGADPLEGMAVDPPPADLVFLVLHNAIEGAIRPDVHEPIIRRSSIEALGGKVDVVLAGHLHTRLDTRIGDVRLLIAGPTERTSFGELDVQPGFLSIETSTVSPYSLDVRRIPTQAQSMRREVIQVSRLPASDPTAGLLELVAGFSHPDLILQIRLAGRMPRSVFHATRFPEVLRFGRLRNFYFDLDRTGLVIDGDDDRPSHTASGRANPAGEVRRVAGKLADGVGSEVERRLVLEARDLVLERIGPARIEDVG